MSHSSRIPLVIFPPLPVSSLLFHCHAYASSLSVSISHTLNFFLLPHPLSAPPLLRASRCFLFLSGSLSTMQKCQQLSRHHARSSSNLRGQSEFFTTHLVCLELYSTGVVLGLVPSFAGSAAFKAGGGCFLTLPVKIIPTWISAAWSRVSLPSSCLCSQTLAFIYCYRQPYWS